MRRSTTIPSLLTMLAVSLAGVTTATINNKMAMTTKSAEATAHLEQALAKLDNFQFDQARELAAKAIAADSNFALAHYFAGALASPPEKGKEQLAKALALSKNASEGERLYIEAMTANRSGDKAKANKLLTTLSKQLTGERRVHFNLAQVQFEQKQLDTALATLQTVIKLEPTYTPAYNLRANISLLKGDYAAARKNYHEAIRLTPKDRGNIGSYYGIASSFLYEDQPDSALAALDRGLADFQVRSPQGVPVFVWNSKARINLENGRLEEAMKCYEKGYSLVPGSTLPADQKQLWLGRLHHGKGRTLAQMGRHAEAWAHADTIKMMIEANGEAGKEYWPSYYYLAGYLKLESGDHAQALEYLKQADQTDHFIKLLLARAYEATGEKDKARGLLQEIVNVPEPGLDRALVYQEARNKLKMYSAK